VGCHTEQPWKLLARHIVQPTPCNEKRLGNDVVHDIRRGTTIDIGSDRAIVAPEHSL
jgi:hypothetical protein